MSRRRMMYNSSTNSLLPKEYEAVEYVMAFHITTTINAHNTVWDFDIDNPAANGGMQMFVACNVNGGCYAAVQNGKYSLGGGITSSGSSTGRQTPKVQFYGTYVNIIANGETLTRTATSYNNNLVQLFELNGIYKYSGKVYSIKCDDGDKFYGIPCKRVSDDTVGIYDVVSKTFYAKP